jgi:hypothetical protein
MPPKTMKKGCNKCNKDIKTREYLKCSKCLQIYHILCTANVTSARFNLMSIENRSTWKCYSCFEAIRLTSKQNSSENNCQPSTSHELSTPRHAVRQQDKDSQIAKGPSLVLQRFSMDDTSVRYSESEDDDSLTTTLNSTTRSLPGLSNVESAEVTELKVEISTLTCQVESAHAEIDRLNSEIFEYKNILSEKQKKLELYKKLLGENGSSTSTRKSTLSKKTLNRRNSVPCSKNDSISNSVATQTVAQQEVTTIRNPETDKLTEHPSTNSHRGHLTSPRESVARSTTKNKLAVLSCNKRNNIYSIIEDDPLLSKFECCHFKTPGGGIRESLHKLEYKLSNFTMKDYCVILIGEEDFLENENYPDLVQYIVKNVTPIVHTNIILACPTYICGKPMYNSKVESFNMLLRSNVSLHEKHFSFDSNLDLSFDMFSNMTGRINNRGLANIIHHVGMFIAPTAEVKLNSMTAKQNAKKMQKKISDYFVVIDKLTADPDHGPDHEPIDIFRD